MKVDMPFNKNQTKQNNLEKMHWNIKNIVMITIKHFVMDQILALDNPEGVDMLLNKETKSNHKIKFAGYFKCIQEVEAQNLNEPC